VKRGGTQAQKVRGTKNKPNANPGKTKKSTKNLTVMAWGGRKGDTCKGTETSNIRRKKKEGFAIHHGWGKAGN